MIVGLIVLVVIVVGGVYAYANYTSVPKDAMKNDAMMHDDSAMMKGDTMTASSSDETMMMHEGSSSDAMMH